MVEALGIMASATKVRVFQNSSDHDRESGGWRAAKDYKTVFSRAFLGIYV